MKGRVGVFSFARYDPRFYGERGGADRKQLLLRRSLKIMVHELGHMFGMQHCIHYACVMNGVNHLEEADSRPQHLCPVCLRKLQWLVGFDPMARYAALEQLYASHQMDGEATWVRQRLATIRSQVPASLPGAVSGSR
jgi:archaemetzincin